MPRPRLNSSSPSPAQQVQGPQHGVLVHAQHRGEVPGQRQALTRAGLALRDGPGRWVRLAALRRDLWAQMAYPVRIGAEVTETTVIYSGIGLSQHITAPPHPVTSG
jgi:hypothetical protein